MKQRVQKKRRFFTIIELMFVIVIISLIAGVIAYNMQGVLDKGRAAKTRLAIEKLDAILNLTVAENPAFIDTLEENWENAVKSSPLAQNPDSVIYDGWGNKFNVTKEDGKIVISSEAYEKYKEKNPSAI